jgi:hypothetical protein
MLVRFRFSIFVFSSHIAEEESKSEERKTKNDFYVKTHPYYLQQIPIP